MEPTDPSMKREMFQTQESTQAQTDEGLLCNCLARLAALDIGKLFQVAMVLFDFPTRFRARQTVQFFRQPMLLNYFQRR